jgi:hypothetical protein
MAAWTVLYSGSNTISTTEFSLTLNTTSGAPASKTDKGTIQLVLDVNAMIAGDQYELKLYDAARSGDTQRLVSRWILTGAQAEVIFMTPALMLGEAWDYTLKRLAGSDRTIISSIRSYG